jgi:hypothetical protein
MRHNPVLGVEKGFDAKNRIHYPIYIEYRLRLAKVGAVMPRNVPWASLLPVSTSSSQAPAFLEEALI